MNAEKYDKKTQERLEKLFKSYKFALNIFLLLAIILIIYGAITESWIRFLSGVISMFISLIMVGVTEKEANKIEEEVKKIKSEKGEDDKN